ncbi:hypothetical protein AEGHOMDF_1441 [Methylobacterium soli]|jgi:hypothetical protein|nr:hypothetical protein AEGHOMDF_1441 [Methylobacterium soli]
MKSAHRRDAIAAVHGRLLTHQFAAHNHPLECPAYQGRMDGAGAVTFCGMPAFTLPGPWKLAVQRHPPAW